MGILIYHCVTVNITPKNMPSKQAKSSPKKRTLAKKSNKIGKKNMSPKRSSKKNKEGKKKRTAPAALVKVMNVSAPLADIIGVKRASRPQAIKGLWAYIKKHDLQDPNQRQYFTPDAKMEKVFGKSKMKAIQMSKFLSANLKD